ncbi:MAG: hypothetical protein PHW04_04860 [Candidatus Wallbacteria bacterium]|nr:hypothetical protein [Candidatus Wallbacteria bacterium]
MKLMKTGIVILLLLSFAVYAEEPRKAGNLLDILPDISKELGLTTDQEIKLTPIINAYLEELKKLKESVKDDDASRKQAMEKIPALKEKLVSDASTVLNPEQITKFKEILARLEKSPVEAMVEKIMNTLKQELKLTDEVAGKIEALYRDQFTQMGKIKDNAEASNNNIFEKSRILKQMQEVQAGCEEKILALLSEDQKVKFKEMQKDFRENLKDKAGERKDKKNQEKNEKEQPGKP